MKKFIMFFVAAMVAISLATVSYAGDKKVMGEVTKMEGDFVTVKDEKGKEMKIHTDKTTKMTGDIKAGSHVEAEVSDKGHATSITAKDMKK